MESSASSLDFQGRRQFSIGPGQGIIPQLGDLNPTIGGTAKGAGPAMKIGAVKGVQGELEMGVSMLQAHEVAVHADTDAQLLPYFPPQALLQRLALLLLPTGKLPQPAQKASGASPGEEKSLAFPDDPSRDVVVRPWWMRGKTGQAGWGTRGITGTEGAKGTLGTSRILGPTNQGAQIHEGLVEGTSSPIRQQGFGQMLQALEPSWSSRVILEQKNATEDPDRVPVKNGPGAAIGDAGQGSRRVVSHPRQAPQDFQLGGNFGSVISQR